MLQLQNHEAKKQEARFLSVTGPLSEGCNRFLITEDDRFSSYHPPGLLVFFLPLIQVKLIRWGGRINGEINSAGQA